jgi:hypothetical protein
MQVYFSELLKEYLLFGLLLVLFTLKEGSNQTTLLTQINKKKAGNKSYNSL